MQYKSKCHVLIEKEDGCIENVSSSAFTMLGLTLAHIEKNSTKITELIPNFFSETQEYLSK